MASKPQGGGGAALKSGRHAAQVPGESCNLQQGGSVAPTRDGSVNFERSRASAFTFITFMKQGPVLTDGCSEHSLPLNFTTRGSLYTMTALTFFPVTLQSAVNLGRPLRQ